MRKVLVRLLVVMLELAVQVLSKLGIFQATRMHKFRPTKVFVNL